MPTATPSNYSAPNSPPPRKNATKARAEAQGISNPSDAMAIARLRAKLTASESAREKAEAAGARMLEVLPDILEVFDGYIEGSKGAKRPRDLREHVVDAFVFDAGRALLEEVERLRSDTEKARSLILEARARLAGYVPHGIDKNAHSDLQLRMLELAAALSKRGGK